MPYVSAPLPVVSMRSGILAVRSGLIAVHCSPLVANRKTRLPAEVEDARARARFRSSGEFQWKRKRGLRLRWAAGLSTLICAAGQVEAVELPLLRLGVDDVRVRSGRTRRRSRRRRRC